jgi:ABC-type polysaccharide/polyol phosphate transport system ATPase subunit/GT2 family glycosyltransferase/predicted SAM-dependent methyltransferase
VSTPSGPALKADRVSKVFELQSDRRTNLKERFVRGSAKDARQFWALRDISFEVPSGSTFGLIGSNGSGKSTMLKLLAGIHRPTSGTVTATSRVSAMIELGAGFHPELSGRENIYLNGSILGLGKKRIEAAIDEIVEFSGLESKFIDAPVKVYSSGMYVRLGFSIAANLDPEILLIDEIVAVGDEEFQRRCFDHLYKLRRQGVTIVFVSHSLPLVQTLCDHAAWIDHGEMRAEGTALEVVDTYLRSVNEAEASRLEAAGATAPGDERGRRGTGEIELTRVEFVDAGGTPRAVATTGLPMTVRVHFRVVQPVDDPVFGLAFHHESGAHLSGPNSFSGGLATGPPRGGGAHRLRDGPAPAAARRLRRHRRGRRPLAGPRLRLPRPGLRPARPARPAVRPARARRPARPVEHLLGHHSHDTNGGPAVRVNLGCGQAYMEGWTNVDASRDVKADIYMEAAEFLRQYADEIDEVYMGHVLEHIMPGDALVTLRIMNERLRPGTVVSAVTPDMDAIFAEYLDEAITNDQLNASFIYSYVQPSPHVWCYGPASLAELFRRAGFTDVAPIDPLTWGPVFWKEGEESKWQCGVRAPATGTAGPTDVELSDAALLTSADAARPERPGPPDVPTTEELLLRRVRLLRGQLLREHERRAAAEVRVAELTPPPPPAEPVVPEPAPVPAPRRPAGAQAGPPPLTARQVVRRVAEVALPLGTPRRAVARAAWLTVKEVGHTKRRLQATWNIPGAVERRAPSYETWRRSHDASPAGLAGQRELSRTAAQQPSTLVVVLAHDPQDVDAVSRSIASVRAQSWAHWSVAVASAAVPVEGVEAVDVSVWWGPTGRLAEAVNAAVANAVTDFVVVLDAGDRLAPDCLYQVALASHRDPLVDLVTWDDDRLVEGVRTDPRFRPSWSPDLLTGADYVGHSFAVRRTRYLVVDGVRDGFDDAMTWDLLLRADLGPERVARVPRVLAHVGRRYDEVTPGGVRAVQEHLDRTGVPATAVAAGQGVRTRWDTGTAWPTVTIVIPTRHNRRMLSTCLPSLTRTEYPGGVDVVVVDNGGHSDDNARWYEQHAAGLDLRVHWWTQTPFNYSAVNNHGASLGDGEVLVFLNDDTEVLDPGWLTEVVGWARRPEIGVAGLQLLGPDGELQHAGAVLGLGGFADHVFEGMAPGSPSLLGPTGWYRNVLAVTGACLAVRRDRFDELGGFDERFVLTGSDVALGLDAVIKGYRNVCSPYAAVRHLESATRGTHVPVEDFFASYWRYNPWLFGGDPYYSPSLSLGSRTPRLKGLDEPSPGQRLSGPLGRPFAVFRQRNDEAESRMLADNCRALPVDRRAVEQLHAANREPFAVRTVNWFIPDIDSPFYGGINTALRIADQLAREHGVQNRFVVWGSPPDHFIRSALAAAFPSLADAPISFYDGSTGASLEAVPEADVAIATLWVTAYAVAHFPGAKRKFYLVQDFEPMFYPASTLYALTEESYRLGLYGLCNTDNLRQIYTQDYDGTGMSFTPAVDPTVFHARGRVERMPQDPATVFVYARPGHWRNCWELASLALEELKDRLGDRVRIVTAGSWAVPEGGFAGMHHYGLLDYRATGELYRTCDLGMALTVSKHPSYLPLELMACGVPVVAFDNPWGHWVLQDGTNSLLAKRTVDGLVEALERGVLDYELRSGCARGPWTRSRRSTARGRRRCPGSTRTCATRRAAARPPERPRGRRAPGRRHARGAGAAVAACARGRARRRAGSPILEMTCTCPEEVMSFASPLFLWYFLPGFLLLYWLLPGRFRNVLVSLASLALYAFGGGSFVLGLVAVMVVNFFSGISLDSAPMHRRPAARRALLVATVLFDLSVLAVWKYAGFATSQVDAVSRSLDGPGVPIVELALPIGISFFTFHHISYIVDVYRHSRHAQRSPVQFATYIAMFPQLVAGPIVRYHEIDKQLADTDRDRLDDFAAGFPRFALGLTKKVVVADALAPVADAVFALPRTS